ncbi:MerR family transcriptional regulator [Lysinibacillus telephonicus]|uniref:MerR family transcriptional regulator n=2 Tax=Lysinibacillus telephonicus TaxID=1714840 RepID=A0A3S0QVW2_9BACI|nr:MerR family transcriptional regulator [Lysinibacillus telephonicus]RTQ93342.1 MerR family transcriptional regulator [Lysinibacillus telephonicus]
MNNGVEKLRIGELAEITGITKRTIDYYTNLGLLKAERSTSNYRYYKSDAIERLYKIEEMKSSGMSLKDIKNSFEKEHQYEEIDIQELRLHMQTLQNEVTTLLEQMKQQEQTTQTTIKNNVSKESVALMQSLLLLIT